MKGLKEGMDGENGEETAKVVSVGATDSKSEVESGQEEVKESTSTVVFARKRSAKRKLREKTSDDRDDGARNDKAEDETAEKLDNISKNDLEVLLEAQRMREARRKWKNTSASAGRGSIRIIHDEDEEPVLAGLRSNFATERENEHLEQQCERYIEEKMVSRGYGSSNKSNVDDGRDNDDELYRVPENLRVKEKSAYDPGEGLPAAGLEEVELDDSTRKQNEEETMRAIQNMRKARARATDHIVAEHFKKRFKR
eukprot:Plantae.Rhodophyta-Purpureofilum_apyrenoidigerum.ctg1160.p1 GENE.Plantae.Rhodophyta-Purpureofilum_apyrenoidigerum.ctg1160~~Plantae.Rhodophyta-Purpureofilum_apyrenoidigerum.ctg1160.p1  ORF type:complete len:254 (-),score=73.19 Plantae.Rhodophyta-Purpureofilum_apyrenoidigerum.ctg1160:350-1111(-)